MFPCSENVQQHFFGSSYVPTTATMYPLTEVRDPDELNPNRRPMRASLGIALSIEIDRVAPIRLRIRVRKRGLPN